MFIDASSGNVVYQILLAGCEVALLYAMRRQPRLPLPGVFGIIAFLGVVLAVPFAADMFHLLLLWSFAIFLHAPAVLFVTAVLLWIEKTRVAIACVLAGQLLLGIYVHAFHFEPTALEVNHHPVSVAGLDDRLRIAVLADLQTDEVGTHERRAIAAAFEAEPDLILLPGDYLQLYGPERKAQAIALRTLFQNAEPWPPLGVVAVGGNVDPKGWDAIFAGTRVQPILQRQTFELRDGVSLTGIDLRRSFNEQLRLKRPDSARVHIVFGHAPDFALGNVDADLLIAGHTHGGQVRLPLLGPLLTLSAVPDSWASGVTRLPEERTLIVSRGIGMERGNAPRLRFLCPPEVVIVDAVPR